MTKLPSIKEQLAIAHISFKDACDYVNEHHRHHIAPQGHKFSIAATKNNAIVGVVICGRPVARYLDDGDTLEVTRLASNGTRNTCSFLYQAAWRATRALGYKRLITYILESESGTSLRAAGWKCLGSCGGGSWDRSSRKRSDKHPLQEKIKWEKQ